MDVQVAGGTLISGCVCEEISEEISVELVGVVEITSPMLVSFIQSIEGLME